MNTEVIWNFLSTQGADFALKVLGALAAWVVGRWLIGIVVTLIGRALEAGKRVDATLIQPKLFIGVWRAGGCSGEPVWA